MRLVFVIALASCTIGAPSRRARDAAPMPSDVLDHQDPGADLAKHPIISRSVASYHGSLELDGTGGAYEAIGAIGLALAAGAVK